MSIHRLDSELSVLRRNSSHFDSLPTTPGTPSGTPSASTSSKVPLHYQPPWNNVSIIGIAGSSGSGKSSLARAIVAKLNLPWVVILGMDSFYKELGEEDHQKAHRNELDFDSPEAIDFDVLVGKLWDLKQG